MTAERHPEKGSSLLDGGRTGLFQRTGYSPLALSSATSCDLLSQANPLLANRMQLCLVSCIHTHTEVWVSNTCLLHLNLKDISAYEERIGLIIMSNLETMSTQPIKSYAWPNKRWTFISF